MNFRCFCFHSHVDDTAISSNFETLVKRFHAEVVPCDQQTYVKNMVKNWPYHKHKHVICLFHPPHSLHLPPCLINSFSEVVFFKHLKSLFGSMLHVFLSSLHLFFSLITFIIWKDGIVIAVFFPWTHVFSARPYGGTFSTLMYNASCRNQVVQLLEFEIASCLLRYSRCVCDAHRLNWESRSGPEYAARYATFAIISSAASSHVWWEKRASNERQRQ